MRGLIIIVSSPLDRAVVERHVVEGTHRHDPDASAAQPNAGSGILVTGATNRIGGTTAAARNVISGNAAHGIQIAGAAADGNQVPNNYIGTNRTGASAVANTLAGIDVAGGASGTVVGGTAAGSGNLLSGNLWDGIRVRQTGTDDTVIQGNRIGTDATGLAPIPNGTYGVLVFVDAPENTTIGGSTPAARNTISGNTWNGIAVFGAAGTRPTGVSIQGNFIGTTSAGDAPLPNLLGGVGIFEASDNAVGATVAGSGNVVAFNGGPGIVVSVGERNAIRRNSVFANVGLGLDLGGDGITANDESPTAIRRQCPPELPGAVRIERRRAGHAQQRDRTRRSRSSSSATPRATRPETAKARPSSAR